jgi:hypothetical protein
MAKSNKRHLSQKEKEDWTTLCEYVKVNIMGYDQNQSLSRQMILRLRGLSTNKFIANNNIDDTANYSYSVILNTFKYCSLKIYNGLKINSFKDENHKFNYVLKIVESNLNDVYMRTKSAEKVKEETERHDTSNASTYVNTFKSKENNPNKNKKYDDLW